VSERYGKLAARFQRHVAPLREEVEVIQDQVRQAVDDLDVDLPTCPKAKPMKTRIGSGCSTASAVSWSKQSTSARHRGGSRPYSPEYVEEEFSEDEMRRPTPHTQYP
jgi:hypothetical protein